MKLVMVGAGECATEKLARELASDEAFALVAVDGGYRVCKELGRTPDLALGDFDSLGFVPDDCPVLAVSPIKDESDLELALRWALERGFTEARMFGFTGGRLDHTLAALQVCAWACEQGFRLALVARDAEIRFLVGPDVLEIPSREKGTVSLFAMNDEISGLTIEGLLYQVQDATLTSRSSRGLSNEFIGGSARISLSEGTAVVIVSDL